MNPEDLPRRRLSLTRSNIVPPLCAIHPTGVARCDAAHLFKSLRPNVQADKDALGPVEGSTHRLQPGGIFILVGAAAARRCDQENRVILSGSRVHHNKESVPGSAQPLRDLGGGHVDEGRGWQSRSRAGRRRRRRRLGATGIAVIASAREDDKTRPKAWGEVLALGISDGEETVDCLRGVLVPPVSEYNPTKERGCTNSKG